MRRNRRKICSCVYQRKKEELEGEFAAEREELEADYQKQVDDMLYKNVECYIDDLVMKSKEKKQPPMRSLHGVSHIKKVPTQDEPTQMCF